MVEQKLGLLLVVEVVEGAGFEGVEAIISGSKNGHSLRSVVELIVKLSVDFAFVQQPNEGAELPSFFKNARYVDRPCRRRGRRRRGLAERLREQEERQEDEEEDSHGGGDGGGGVSGGEIFRFIREGEGEGEGVFGVGNELDLMATTHILTEWIGE